MQNTLNIFTNLSLLLQPQVEQSLKLHLYLGLPVVNICCCIMPHPRTSIHSPLKNISNSQEGCVNGKYADTHRDLTSKKGKS